MGCFEKMEAEVLQSLAQQRMRTNVEHKNRKESTNLYPVSNLGPPSGNNLACHLETAVDRQLVSNND